MLKNSPNEHPATILAINGDQEGICRITQVLRQAGFRVREARTGGEALHVAAADADLILLVDTLPDMSSSDVCRRLKADPATAAIPLLQVSATAAEGEDADDYLTPPLEPVQLVASVRAWLRVRQAEAREKAARQTAEKAIQERARAEAALRANEERLRLALDIARLSVWDWNIETGKVDWSHNSEGLVKASPGSFCTTYESFLQAVHPEDRPSVRQGVAGCFQTGVYYSGEFRVVLPDQEVRWLAVSGQILRDESGQPVRMVGVGLDITTRKRLEEELRQRLEELGEVDRHKNNFLATLGHELRNPLASISAAVLLLGRKGQSESKLQWARGVIDRRVHHLARILDDLLDVSRIGRGKLRLQKQGVELASVVAGALETCRPLIDERRQTLTVALPPGVVRLEADPTRLEQVLANLLNNAAKYTPERGHISLRAERDGGEVILRVKDDGMGIAPEMLPRVFEMFAQSDLALTNGRGGLGIGLTLVKHLVEMHGGRVEAFSEGPGRGSELVVHLPLLPADGRGDEETCPNGV